MYYDRQGNRITSSQERELRLADPRYKRVAKTRVGKAEVSTIWLGLDHSLNGGRPLIFETMVFGGKHDTYQERYSTETEARKGHDRIVRMVKPWWKRWGIAFRKGE